MRKLKKKNLFIEINDDNFFVAVGEYDDELNFKIVVSQNLPLLTQLQKEYHDRVIVRKA